MPKIEELRIIAKSTNATIIGISESKLDESVLEPDIQIDSYRTFRCDGNRHGGGVAFYLFFQVKSKESSLKSCYLIPNQITIGTIYRPPNQSNFLEVLIETMNKIDSISYEIYILGNFNITYMRVIFK